MYLLKEKAADTLEFRAIKQYITTLACPYGKVGIQSATA